MLHIDDAPIRLTDRIDPRRTARACLALGLAFLAAGKVRPEAARWRLREGLARYEWEPGDEQLRDGLNQRFEFTYELSHKMLRRYLREVVASPDELERMAFPDLIRTGNAQGLLQRDRRVWRWFREMRARTSHTYDAKVASQIVSGIPELPEEAEHFYTELQRGPG